MTYFIDSNVLVKAFTENKDKERCEKMLVGNFFTDTLCLLEALQVITFIRKDREFAARAIKSLFKHNCVIIDAGKDAMFEMLSRTERYNLPFFDLVHFTNALLHNCTEFVSYDKDFDNLEIKRVEP